MAKDTWAVIGPLYEHHGQWVTIASKLVGSTDAEDVVHDAYLRVARAARSKDDAKMMTATIRNLAIDRLRKRSREVPLTDGKLDALRATLDVVPSQTIEAAMFVADFNAALMLLSDEQAQAFILIQLRGLSQTETADVLGVNQSTVARNYERGRRNLARELQ